MDSFNTQANAIIIKSFLANKGAIEFPAAGNSMYPLIKQGDSCTFISCNLSTIKKGDILLFQTDGGRLIAHRYMKSYRKQAEQVLVCKGDSNLGYDQAIRPEQVIGKLSLIQKRRISLRTNSFLVKAWGMLVLSLPMISAVIRRFLNSHDKRYRSVEDGANQQHR